MDHASEWKIYWRIVLPLAPALAVLAIFSVMWRWNDFLWPLIVLSNEHFTLQLALNAFQGDLVTQWNYLLAMTVIHLLPVTIVFAFCRNTSRRASHLRGQIMASSLQLKQLVKPPNSAAAPQRFAVIHGCRFAGRTTANSSFRRPVRLRQIHRCCGSSAAWKTPPGRHLLDNERVNEKRAADRGLAMVFQSYALYPHMTCIRTWRSGWRTSARQRQIEQKVGDAANCCGSMRCWAQADAALRRSAPARAIGRASFVNRKIFLFDEPLSNLDAELRVSMRSEITGLHRRPAPR